MLPLQILAATPHHPTVLPILLRRDEASRTFQPTPFGKAVLASGLPPEDCLVLKVGLKANRIPTQSASKQYLSTVETPDNASLELLGGSMAKPMLACLVIHSVSSDRMIWSAHAAPL